MPINRIPLQKKNISVKKMFYISNNYLFATQVFCKLRKFTGDVSPVSGLWLADSCAVNLKQYYKICYAVHKSIITVQTSVNAMQKSEHYTL